jgi:hypothetical protein
MFELRRTSGSANFSLAIFVTRFPWAESKLDEPECVDISSKSRTLPENLDIRPSIERRPSSSISLPELFGDQFFGFMYVKELQQLKIERKRRYSRRSVLEEDGSLGGPIRGRWWKTFYLENKKSRANF